MRRADRPRRFAKSAEEKTIKTPQCRQRHRIRATRATTARSPLTWQRTITANVAGNSAVICPGLETLIVTLVMRCMKQPNARLTTRGRNKSKAKRERYAPTRPLRLPSATNEHAADRVSNGSRLINGLDGRSVSFRRWRTLYLQFRQRVPATVEADQLCRALASACVRREQLDTDLCNGKPVDPVAMTRLTSLVDRLLRKLDVTAEAHSGNDEHARRQRQLEDMEAGLA